MLCETFYIAVDNKWCMINIRFAILDLQQKIVIITQAKVHTGFRGAAIGVRF